jgi:catechol 2,3-dioxygenase
MTLPPTIPYLELPAEQIGVQAPGHKAPNDIRIGQVTLQIADLERSLAFYQNVLGFQVLSRNANQAQLGTSDGNVLLELHEKPGVRFAPHRGRLGIYHFALLLPSRGDLGRFLAQALAQGVHVGQSDHHYSEAMYLVDPDGISIEVYRDRPREEWRVTSEGEVIGGGDPLDHDALKEAAAAQAWQGLPVGTILGHLHFYVGDLEPAARFYHTGLGLAKMTWNFPGALFLGANGYHHHIGLNTWAAGSAPSSDNDARLLTWDLILPDQASLNASKASLEQAGFTVTLENGIPHSSDPWGIVVRLKLQGSA